MNINVKSFGFGDLILQTDTNFIFFSSFSLKLNRTDTNKYCQSIANKFKFYPKHYVISIQLTTYLRWGFFFDEC